MTTIYTPRQEYGLTGADLTGVSGAQNRTYTLKYSPSTNQINIYVQAVPYTRDVDFTFNGSVVVFLVAMEDWMTIQIDYYTSSALTSLTYSGQLKYTNTLQLAACLNIAKNVPDWEPGQTPAMEVIGTGDNVATTFYTDNKNVLGNSYVFYFGTTEASATALTEAVDYTLDRDRGKIVLTAGGVTKVGTKNIYGEYSYTLNNVKESFLGDTLSRAESNLDKDLNTTFTNGLVINPNYPAMTEEEHDSQGIFNRVYFTKDRPIIDLSSALASDITASADTLSVTSSEGSKFPMSGRIIIGNEIIGYASISSDTFTGLTRGLDGTTAVAHSKGDNLYTTIVEISSTLEGGVPTWYALARKSDVEVDAENGKVYIYGNSIMSNYIAINGLIPKQDIMKRFKITYLYGWDTIPTDITRLALLLAQRMLFTDTVMSSLVKGRNEFRPELMDNVKSEIEMISENYRHLDMQNT